jgi:uncharacterized protein (TIGR03000 family)
MPAYSQQQSFYPPDGAVKNQGDNTRAFVQIRVAPDAQVFFDDQATQQKGPDRMFVTPPLQDNDPNHPYQYKIRARWTENGQSREETRTVRLTPGRTANVDFFTQANEQQNQQQNQQRIQQPNQQQQLNQQQQNQQQQNQQQQKSKTRPPDNPPE